MPVRIPPRQGRPEERFSHRHDHGITSPVTGLSGVRGNEPREHVVHVMMALREEPTGCHSGPLPEGPVEVSLVTVPGLDRGTRPRQLEIRANEA